MENNVVDAQSDQVTPISSFPSEPVAPISRKKTVVYLLFTLLMMGAMVGGLLSLNSSTDIRSKATINSPVLAINPSTKSLRAGETASIGITLNTNADTMSAAELHLTYDKTAIQVLGFTPGTILPVVLKPATFTNGLLDVVLGVQPTTPFKGSGILGTISIKGLSPKTSTIAFSNTTQTASIGKPTNSLAEKTGSTITITTGATATLTPTRIPGSTNTPTPIPTRTGTPTPTRRPGTTNTPTPIPTRTGTPTPTRRPGTTNTPTPIPAEQSQLPSGNSNVNEVDDYSPFATTAEEPTAKENIFTQISSWFRELFEKLF